MERQRVSKMSLQIMFIVLVSVLNCRGTNANTTPIGKTTILVSLDGVGWKFLEDPDMASTPNMDFVARTGVKAKNMMTVNPTYTFPTHMSYLTGLYPESHGVVSNTFYDPLYDENFYLETDCSNFDPKFFNKTEPIWLTMEKRGLKTGTYFWPSSTSFNRRPSYFADHICKVNCSDYPGKKLEELRKQIGRNHCKFDFYNDPRWHRIETAIRWMKSDSPPRLIMLYFEQTDGVGHKYGPKSPKYPRSIETQDRFAVGYLIEKLKEANLLESTNLIFVSDHSMVPTNNDQQIDLFEYVDSNAYRFMWPGIIPKPGKLDEVYENLTRVNSSLLKVFKKEDIPEKYHWKHNRRVPAIFLDIATGWMPRTSWYNKTAEGEWHSGYHGWPPSQEVAAIFYARGPAFKEGYSFNGSVYAVDIYPLLCHLVGIEPLPNNGSLKNMMQLLKQEKTNSKGNAQRAATGVVVMAVSIFILIINGW